MPEGQEAQQATVATQQRGSWETNARWQTRGGTRCSLRRWRRTAVPAPLQSLQSTHTLPAPRSFVPRCLHACRTRERSTCSHSLASGTGRRHRGTLLHRHWHWQETQGDTVLCGKETECKADTERNRHSMRKHTSFAGVLAKECMSGILRGNDDVVADAGVVVGHGDLLEVDDPLGHGARYSRRPAVGN